MHFSGASIQNSSDSVQNSSPSADFAQERRGPAAQRTGQPQRRQHCLRVPGPSAATPAAAEERVRVCAGPHRVDAAEVRQRYVSCLPTAAGCSNLAIVARPGVFRVRLQCSRPFPLRRLPRVTPLTRLFIAHPSRTDMHTHAPLVYSRQELARRSSTVVVFQ